MVRIKPISFILCICLWFSLFSPQTSFAETSSPVASKQEENVNFQMLQSGKPPQSSVTESSYMAPEQPTVYLTFDDGPSKLTEHVLNILQTEKIQATFFMIGEEAESHPDLVKRVVSEGHAIGNHSYDHVYKELYTDYGDFWNQIKKSEQIFNKLAGFNPQLVRAPGGTSTNFDAFYFYFLEQAGYIVTDWNVDSGDSERRNVPAAEIVQNIKKAPLRHEMTVLIHDGNGHQSSVEALSEIIQYFKENGYTFARLTPEVKPVQFPVVKTKWKRSMSFEHYQALLTESRTYATLWVTPSTEAEPAVKADVSKQQAEVLTLNTLLTKGKGELSIRSFFEKKGGQVRWLDEKRTALIHYGFYDIEFNVTHRTIQLYLYGKQVSSYSLVPMSLDNGTLCMPRSDTWMAFGGGAIGGFLTAEGWEQSSIGISRVMDV